MERGQNPKGSATKELAAKAGTTVGKIDDIKKNRNFAYVVEETRFTQAQWMRLLPRRRLGHYKEMIRTLFMYL